MGLFGRSRHTQEEDENQQTVSLPAPPPESVSFDTVLGPGSTMRGRLHTPGSVRLEGTFEGELTIDGNALVGEKARIIADIIAGNNVTVAGAVRGNVSGKRVQLLRTGRVWGDIEASSISTEEGAFIQGTITMKGGEIPPVFEDMVATGPLELPEVGIEDAFEDEEELLDAPEAADDYETALAAEDYDNQAEVMASEDEDDDHAASPD